MEKMRRHARVVSLGFDPFALALELVPVEQHGGERCQQAVGNLMLVASGPFRFEATEGRTASAQNIHRVRVGGQLFQDSFQGRRQAAQRTKFLSVILQLGSVGQRPVKQEKGSLLKGRLLREIVYRIAT